MKRRFLIILFLVLILFITTIFSQYTNVIDIKTRQISLNNKNIDYQTIFNDFKKQDLIVDKKENIVYFNAIKSLEKDLFEDIDLINLNNSKEINIEYDITYDNNINLFILTIVAKSNDKVLIDKLKGTPFLKEDRKTDIVFSTDDGLIYLSDFYEKDFINNVGWFSWLFKNVAKGCAKVAVTAAVVATAIVAAPLVVPVTAAFVGTSSVSILATATTTAEAVSLLSVATTTALTAGFAEIGTYLASRVFENIEEKVKVAVKELTKIKSKDLGTVLFRGAKKGEAYKIFIPRRGKDNYGLSFFTISKGLNKALNNFKENGLYITSTKFIEQVKIFSYKRDNIDHYSVTLKDGTTFGWTNQHAILLSSISIYIKGLK